MDESRRNFLKITGAGLFGALWAIPVFKAVGKAFESSPKALKAKRWAMALDMKRLGREEVRLAAAKACNTIHNIPDLGVPEEEVKWIWTEQYEAAFPTQVDKFTPAETREHPVLVLCNHCDRPPCVRVCPTKATFKREQDGIVMMDMHRCIGCRYCMAACPYGSRSFNWRDPKPFVRQGIRTNYPTRTKGVVEKCTLCAERLAMGRNPACVDAANKAGGEDTIIFGDIMDPNSRISRVLRSRHTIRRKPSLGTSPQVYYLL